MSHFGLRICKTESPDKTPYTVYYPHTIPSTERRWTQPYYQIVSIDPARKNYALRIERRYHNGWITPVVFDKVSIESIEQEGDTIICNTYQVLTHFLSKYEQFYDDCHFIIIERQLPQNYKATRIAQHSISYFSMRLHNKPLFPSIVEIDPKLKGKILGAPKNINDKQLKTWAIEKARELLTIRKDNFSLQVLDHFRNKQDDLSDTICQIEAIFICWGFTPTRSPPSGPDDTPQDIKAVTLQLIPTMVIPNIEDIRSLITPLNGLSPRIPSGVPSVRSLELLSSVDTLLPAISMPVLKIPVEQTSSVLPRHPKGLQPMITLHTRGFQAMSTLCSLDICPDRAQISLGVQVEQTLSVLPKQDPKVLPVEESKVLLSIPSASIEKNPIIKSDYRGINANTAATQILSLIQTSPKSEGSNSDHKEILPRQPKDVQTEQNLSVLPKLTDLVLTNSEHIFKLPEEKSSIILPRIPSGVPSKSSKEPLPAISKPDDQNPSVLSISSSLLKERHGYGLMPKSEESGLTQNRFDDSVIVTTKGCLDKPIQNRVHATPIILTINQPLTSSLVI